jgi:hypothetical protein
MKKPDKRTPFGTLLVRTDWHPETADARQQVMLLRAALEGLVSVEPAMLPEWGDGSCNYCRSEEYHPHAATCPITLGRAALEATK